MIDGGGNVGDEATIARGTRPFIYVTGVGRITEIP